jgi:mono/diheme cytochrome c family protein
MKYSQVFFAGLGLLVTPLLVQAQAQISYDMGKSVYQDNCASCHGATGKGDGPMKAYLVKAPSDLTTITQRNHGTFPHQRIWEVIDGRSSAEPGPHGSREMPIWGNEFRMQQERAPWWGMPYGGMPYGGMHRGGPEWQVSQKISALVDYLVRIQTR